MYDILSLGEMVLPELRKVADKYEVSHKGLKKQDLIYKFYRLEKKGFKLAKKFNMHSDISEMRSEYKKIIIRISSFKKSSIYILCTIGLTTSMVLI